VKILLVDSATTGHHIPYLNKILSKKQKNIDFFVVVPPGFQENSYHLVELSFPCRKNIIQYFLDRERWLFSLSNIIKQVNPDVVHFLTGDAIYQLGGVGFNSIKKITENLVLTQHHLPVRKSRNVCLRLTAKKFKKIVVHTSAIKRSLVNVGINSEQIEVIDYPACHPVKLDQERAKEKLDLKVEGEILLALGGTRFSKGLDILLEASKLVERKFCLVIAGSEEDFSYEFIKAKIKTISHDIIVRLGKLTDCEFSWYLDAADCIVLPYRKSFDGASGPMTEAIWRRKPVIAPSHGSLGDLVREYNLGYLFESENSKDLAKTIEKYLARPKAFQWTPKAESFRARISPETFAKRYFELYKNIMIKG